MFLPLHLGVLRAVEPGYVAVVAGVSLSGVGNVAVGLYLLFKA